MKNNEHKKVEDLAEVLAEVVGEGKLSEEEQASSDLAAKMQEEFAKDDTQNDQQEKESASDTPLEEEGEKVQEESVEEADALVADAAQTEPKKSRKLFYILLAIVALLGLLTGFYFGMAARYRTCFAPGTIINGTSCKGMTTEEVGNLLQQKVDSYVLTIKGTNGVTDQIKGVDIDITYNGHEQLQEIFQEQNAYEWPKTLFKKKNIQADMAISYDNTKVEEQIAALQCVNPENQTEAVAATVVYQEGQFVIQDETYGTQIDMEKLREAILTAIVSVDSTIQLEESECYLQPRFTKDSPEVLLAKDEMNRYLAANITYSLDNIEVTLGKEQISQWIFADENMTPTVSKEGVRAFVQTLSSKYNTPNRAGQITTPRGKVVDVALARYGRIVGTDAEITQLITEIKEGKTITREPIFSRKETPEGQTIWGSTYMEVDITEQHIWFVVNGQVALETDVITGTKGVHDTPTGVFSILEKVRNKVLRGRAGADGKPSYLQPVDYWMRVTWSGIGFHDAGYRPTFLSHEYLTNGSHGCINMPPEKAAELYAALPIGTPVVIHY